MIQPDDYDDLFKGLFAEAIVEAIFKGSGIHISRSGIEFQDMIIMEQWDIDAQKPDFTFSWKKDSGEEVRERLEVKYRRNGKLSDDKVGELKRNPWKPTIILVQPKRYRGECRIRVIRPPYASRPHGYQYSEPLDKQAHWNINPAICWQCEKLIDLYPQVHEIFETS